jgi:hypothetical protein
MIISLLVLLAFACYVMNPDERARVTRPVIRLLRRAPILLGRARPPARRFAGAVRARHPAALAALAAAAMLILMAAGFGAFRHSPTNVKPEIARLLVAEERTARMYQAAVEQFKLGAVNAEALARLIERTITPELRLSRARLNALDRVPEEDVPLVARADEYLRLRDESWQLRAQALQRRSMPALRKADQAERASLDALERIRVFQP